jgi:NAD(P)-dependent dehydrogenase (short-subunit alcohol dehydrogenase family)
MRNLSKAAPLREAAVAEGLDIRIIQLDVDSQASIDRAVRDVLAEGPIDVLVNNAGVTGVGALEETSDAEFHAVMETNFFGPLRLVRAVLPGMRTRGSGTIVNVSSVAGRLVAPIFSQYHCSKWALECAMETLAIEVKQFGIRVALVEPGFFVTPILDKAPEALTDFESSPYVDLDRRMRDLYAQASAAGGEASVVAGVIEDAVTTTSPRLRYLVGADAEPFVSGRMRLTDEDYQVLGDKQTDEEWWTKFMEMFPMPVEA